MGQMDTSRTSQSPHRSIMKWRKNSYARVAFLIVQRLLVVHGEVVERLLQVIPEGLQMRLQQRAYSKHVINKSVCDIIAVLTHRVKHKSSRNIYPSNRTATKHSPTRICKFVEGTGREEIRSSGSAVSSIHYHSSQQARLYFRRAPYSSSASSHSSA